MLLRIYNSNRAVNYLLIPLIGILLWGKDLKVPQSYPFHEGEAGAPLFAPVHALFANDPFLQVVVALVLVIIIAFVLVGMNSRYTLTGSRSMLPGSIFIILVSGFSGLQTLHPAYFGTLFAWWAMYRLFSAVDNARIYSAAFDAGFFLGMALLFQWNMMILVPPFLYGVGTLFGEIRWRPLVIHLTGILVPLLFAFSYVFFTDRIPELLHVFRSSVMTPNNHFAPDPLLQLYAGLLLILVFAGSIHMIKKHDTRKVSTRRMWNIFFVIFVFSVAAIIFIPAASKELLVLTAVPFSFLISDYLMTMRSRFWKELIFWSLLLFVMGVRLLY